MRRPHPICSGDEFDFSREGLAQLEMGRGKVRRLLPGDGSGDGCKGEILDCGG